MLKKKLIQVVLDSSLASATISGDHLKEVVAHTHTLSSATPVFTDMKTQEEQRDVSHVQIEKLCRELGGGIFLMIYFLFCNECSYLKDIFLKRFYTSKMYIIKILMCDNLQCYMGLTAAIYNSIIHQMV